MSVDTRTPRAPGASGRGSGHSPGGSPRGFFDDEPVLSTVKVPSDPAEVVVNHASFRVRLGASSTAPSAYSSSVAARAALASAASAASLTPATALPVGAAYPAARAGGGMAGAGSGAGHGPAFEDTEPLPVAAGGGVAASGRRSAAAGPAGAPGAARAARRRTPVVWSGGAEPDDTGATKVIQAARTAGLVGFAGPAGTETDPSSTQTLPRVDGAPPRGGAGGGPATVVGPPRGPQPSESGRPVPPGGAPLPPQGEPLLKGVRPTRGAFDGESDEYGAYGERGGSTGHTALIGTVGHRGHGPHGPYGPHDGASTGPLTTIGHPGPHGEDPQAGETAEDRGQDTEGRRRRDGVRHAYYPGRRMNLGVVLLPLRVFLGFITVYAGMGKLCDPVYFDGGERGSMVTWLRSLEPWTIASPLRDFALAHPVGAGLTVAFLQVVVGVLTIFGLWQRVAAGLGALLSAALLMTVSWSSVPAYEAPDIIYLAAWSPLIIAGAPVFSVDGRLASEAWRKLGPRVSLWDLRRRVLRRGTLVASVIVGLALLVGSLLGSAVRSSQTTTLPGRGETPTNRLPGSPMPRTPGEGAGTGQATQGPDGGADGRRGDADTRREDRDPSGDETRPGEGRATSGPESTPSQGRTQGTSQGDQQGTTAPGAQEGTTAPPPQQQQPQQPQATTGSGSAGNGLSRQSSPSGGTSSSGSGGGTSASDGGGSSGGRGALGGLLGGR
ncbi:DoxX family protein [Streptomyces reniochalinae]|uniref:DoxX family membrane protein n=1 Tax=Streptomyces reniochalinae TaxID=2250578 RepID=A0A367EKC6_9ACTN|nr:DoxX family membrane protein [Streptomyces reniochalinae]RCG18085.1 DoxX family membrane protein [Streptomyces reniochalinae]